MMEQFTFLLDGAKKEPLYLQLYHYVKEEIRAGRLKSGERLPSKRAVSAALNVSVNTVESAYEQLEAEGYIQAKNRSGFYACTLTELPAAVTHKREELPPASDEVRPKFSFDTSNVDTQFFPYATWSRISKNLMYGHREFLELGDSRGDHALRKTLSEFLHQTRGVNCVPEQIVVGAGSEYLLNMLAALLGKGHRYAIENPCYRKTYSIFQQAGVTPVLIPLDRFGISIEALEKSEADVVHITPSHQFPIGIIMPASRRSELLNWAAEGRYIIEDDYDSEFRYAGRPIPAMQGMDTGGRVIYLTTFSKSISPSFRLSALVLPDELAQKYNRVFRHYASTVSRYEQHTLEQFIAGGHFERHLNKLRKIYKSRKECLERKLKEIPGGEIIGANAGLHIVFRLPGAEEAWMVAKARDAGVAVQGLSECYMENTELYSDGAVLLGYASLSETEIEAAGDLLKQVWKKLDC